MDGLEGLVYGFRYSKGTDVKTAQSAGYDAYAGTNVTIKDLDRNTNYHIWVQVKAKAGFADSDWSAAYLTVKTKKTDILGYVEIEGSDTAGQELKAVYRNANYMPAGSDQDGTWQWYRETESGDYAKINTGVSQSYTPTSEDIGKRLKAVYTIPQSSNFTGSKEAQTTKIKKQLAVNPAIDSFKQGADTAESNPTLDFTLSDHTGVWYRIQNYTDQAPQIPTQMTEAELTAAEWKKCTAIQMNSAEDHKGKTLTANTTYVLYTVRPETGDTQVSSIMSKQTDVGTVKQKGDVKLTNTTDVKVAEDDSITYTKITYPVVGKTITAELENANNVQGTWKWYKSKTQCGEGGTIAAPAQDSGDWEQLASGYSPTINKANSSLTISEDMWKHYIKAEFVPNKEIGYGGDSIQQVNPNYVRQIYEEEIKIESSTKDGNGDAAAYPGTTITATVENWSKADLNDRLKIYADDLNPEELTGAA
ncbi:hypothetical protein HMPREF0983_04172, partial [Erysipelotrichaceae bacterium 3_1_53]